MKKVCNVNINAVSELSVFGEKEEELGRRLLDEVRNA